jgi:hypothetical protein
MLLLWLAQAESYFTALVRAQCTFDDEHGWALNFASQSPIHTWLVGQDLSPETTETHCGMSFINLFYARIVAFCSQKRRRRRRRRRRKRLWSSEEKLVRKSSLRKKAKPRPRLRWGKRKLQNQKRGRSSEMATLLCVRYVKHASAMAWTYESKACLLTFLIRADNLQ